ncbi:DUF1496 domain-containing protein, partial [Cronobacter sakazakii]
MKSASHHKRGNGVSVKKCLLAALALLATLPA